MKQMVTIFISIVVFCCLYAAVVFAGQQEKTCDEKEPALTHGDTMGRLSGEVLDLVKFYFSASHRTDINGVLSMLVKESAKKGYPLNSLPADDTIQIGVRRYNLGKYSSAHHFATSDGNLWLDIVNYPGVEPIRVIMGDQMHCGHWGRGRWIFYTLNAEDNAITAVFRTDTQLVNVGVSLPIKLPDPLKLKQTDFQCINTQIDTLYDVTRLVVRNLVSDEEIVMMPLLPGEQLTAAQRIVGFVRFWSEVKYNFAFFDQVPEINWNNVLDQYLPDIMRAQTTTEYYRLLQKICALLKDGHTNIYPPGYVMKFFDEPKIRLRNVKHRAIVVNAGKSLKDTLPLGSKIIAVDGVAIETYLQNEIFPYISSSTDHILWDWGIRDLLKGHQGTEVTITFRTLEGKRGEVRVARNSKMQNEEWIHTESRPRRQLEFERLEHEIAYVALTGFTGKRIVEDFENHLPKIRKSKGLILDIRKNTGGNSSIAFDILKHLTNQPFAGVTWKTPEHRPAYKAWGKIFSKFTPQQLSLFSNEDRQLIKKSIPYYQKKVWYESEPETIQPKEGIKIVVPIVVLIGHVTGSAAEDFLIAMDSIKRATFIGQKTGGSTGQPLMFSLPGGGSARICTLKATYPDGHEFVGYGISPHVYVEPTVEDILNHRDVVLEKAIELLREKISSMKNNKTAVQTSPHLQRCVSLFPLTAVVSVSK